MKKLIRYSNQVLICTLTTFLFSCNFELKKLNETEERAKAEKVVAIFHSNLDSTKMSNNKILFSEEFLETVSFDEFTKKHRFYLSKLGTFQSKELIDWEASNSKISDDWSTTLVYSSVYTKSGALEVFNFVKNKNDSIKILKYHLEPKNDE